ncbi:MAG: PQQ-dependent sugar dehydrogenase [Bdellovibrionales bacterium]|nr:PQQ-dependent sugar dehydrogenase [Bdellovibrionales bacterium]
MGSIFRVLFIFSAFLPSEFAKAATYERIATGLDNPWGMAFLPDGRALITEKEGQIRILKDGKILPQKVENIPAVYTTGQGGLLDVQVHPKNGFIYFTYAKPDSAGGGTVLARAKLDSSNRLFDLQEIFKAVPTAKTGVHFGSRIAFDENGYVYVSTGERGTKPNAQDLSNHLGKIIRLHDDGKIPSDNPFVKTPLAKPEIWSYGHRNVQGLFYDRSKKTLYAHEHGPRGGDELNKIEKGKNYGWPVITYGIDYDGSKISDLTAKEGMEQPIHQWTPSIAPCGLTRVGTTGKTIYPAWRGNFLVGALSHRLISRIEVDAAGKFVREEKLFEGIGRVRFVTEAPDGSIYFGTESPGAIYRIQKP